MDTKTDDKARMSHIKSVETDASNLLIPTESAQLDGLMQEIELKSGEQTRVFLGYFEASVTNNRFSVIVKPETADEGVVRRITKLELQNGQYELVLHMANYNDIVTSLEIRQLQSVIDKEG